MRARYRAGGPLVSSPYIAAASNPTKESKKNMRPTPKWESNIYSDENGERGKASEPLWKTMAPHDMRSTKTSADSKKASSRALRSVLR